MSTKAILLIAHGSRRAEANNDLLRLADMVRERKPDGFSIVEVGFLELAEPDVPAGFAKCVEHGAAEVRIVPFFLSMGVHMANDLAELKEQFHRDYPTITVDVRPPLGLHDKVVDVVLERCGVFANS